MRKSLNKYVLLLQLLHEPAFVVPANSKQLVNSRIVPLPYFTPFSTSPQDFPGVINFFLYLRTANQRQSDSETDPRGDGRAGRSRDLPEYAP